MQMLLALPTTLYQLYIVRSRSIDAYAKAANFRDMQKPQQRSLLKMPN